MTPKRSFSGNLIRGSLNRLDEKPNPSGSGYREEYNRNHVVPVFIGASSSLLDPNPLGGKRRATGQEKASAVFSAAART